MPDARKWFQLYPWEDEAGSYEMVTRARDLGWEALVVTIDAAPGRGREHNERNGYSFPFKPNVTAAVDMMMHPGWMWSAASATSARGGFLRLGRIFLRITTFRM